MSGVAVLPVPIAQTGSYATPRETNGGQTTTSTPSSSCSRRPRQNSAAAAGPLYIFQLPAISTYRCYSALASEDGRDRRAGPLDHARSATLAITAPAHEAISTRSGGRESQRRPESERATAAAGARDHSARSARDAATSHDSHREAPADRDESCRERDGSTQRHRARLT